MPAQEEEQHEGKEADTDDELDKKENKEKPIEKECSPNPIGNNGDDCERLEDRQNQVDDIGIVELVVVREPAAADQMAIDRCGSDQIHDRINDGLHIQRSAGGSRRWVGPGTHQDRLARSDGTDVLEDFLVVGMSGWIHEFTFSRSTAW